MSRYASDRRRRRGNFGSSQDFQNRQWLAHFDVNRGRDVRVGCRPRGRWTTQTGRKGSPNRTVPRHPRGRSRLEREHGGVWCTSEENKAHGWIEQGERGNAPFCHGLVDGAKPRNRALREERPEGTLRQRGVIGGRTPRSTIGVWQRASDGHSLVLPLRRGCGNVEVRDSTPIFGSDDGRPAKSGSRVERPSGRNTRSHLAPGRDDGLPRELGSCGPRAKGRATPGESSRGVVPRGDPRTSARRSHRHLCKQMRIELGCNGREATATAMWCGCR